MTECEEVACSLETVAPHFTSHADCVAWVREQMSDETFVVIANVAWALWRSQKHG